MSFGITASACVNTTPKQISGLTVWFDGQDPAGNNSPPSDGTSISSWVDKSANAQTVTQGTGSKQPVFHTGVINNHSGLLFSNSVFSELFRTNVSVFNSLNSYYIFGVIRPNSTANNCVFCFITDGTDNIYNQLTNASLNQLRLDHITASGSDNLVSGNNAWLANTNFLMQSSRDAGAASIQTVTSSNGVTASLHPLTQGAVSASNKTLALGTNDAGPSGNTINGYFGAFIFYNHMLTSAQINVMKNYILQKWGISS